MATPIQVPNPFTPLAFFPPDLAFQLNVTNYALVGSLSAFIWDVFINLYSDWRMLKMKRIGPSLVVYFLSRSFTAILSSIITNASSYRVSNLAYLLGMTVVLIPISFPTTSMLFFFRVRAMYAGNNWVIGFFFCLWLGVVAASITFIPGASASFIGPTGYCFISNIARYVGSSSMIFAINDTLVFCACTWRLMRNSYIEPDMKNGISIMVFGRHLPAFSRALLQDGQAYYLTTVGLSLLTACLFLIQSVPAPYRAIMGIPNIVLVNNMACHVYRNVRLGVYREFSADKPSGLGKSEAPLSTLKFNRSLHVKTTVMQPRSDGNSAAEPDFNVVHIAESPEDGNSKEKETGMMDAFSPV
ncbi:hypothetical protein CPB84DRAFT_1669070 [Gymnopilus junonius]|uniref:Transmembrane protein n=1 Tax=Gymnopilus junonius TaxID=109634 RepID=A0A9P5P5F4_GYMJU|nr:hypothetical protein CPB84DRAFT_1669070 [Gymnopilus junonius]